MSRKTKTTKTTKTTKDGYPTEKTVGDAIHTIAKVGIGMVPIVSVPASELLNCLVTPPLEKRRIEFFEDVGRRLKDLEDREIISLKELPENEKFIDVTMMATQAALRTSEKEKRAMLRNAIINSAKPVSPELAIQQMFINYVDYFTVWHIKILAFVSDPLRWAKNHNHEFKDIQAGGLATILEDAFPDLRGGRGFYEQFWKDLHFRSLIKQESLQKVMTKSTLMAKNTTNTGEKFLIYISDEQGNIE